MNAPQKTPPTVSIILPTYNRARFLPQAFEAIRAQQFTDWELIVVDDGSTDGSETLIRRELEKINQPSRLLCQENQGAAAARNTGLDHVAGEYIAFYDSDDLWLRHHLQDCVEGLLENPGLDWVFGACRIVEETSGAVRADNTFYVDGEPRPFMKLQATQSGRLTVIDDSRVFGTMVSHGLYNGPQNSVVRTTSLGEARFPLCEVGEDQLLSLGLCLDGRRFGYFDNVHVEYRVHNANLSAITESHNPQRKQQIFESMISGFERLLAERQLTRAARGSLRRRIANDLFWKVGYATCLQQGKHAEALQAFDRALRHWPWDWRCWKTYWLTRIRSFICSPSRHNVQDTKTVG